ncbi:hypothetical protein CDAR_70891 [Caerostris darwini]|uniref:Uncharacterized protein n=1 Tax=Caerostris darwini TaxID=1538125 RepID=A0AAV4WFB2_9ARAC|nr:hypothetical protein CDAR_70891 [Caerostris darwini]
MQRRRDRSAFNTSTLYLFQFECQCSAKSLGSHYSCNSPLYSIRINVVTEELSALLEQPSFAPSPTPFTGSRRYLVLENFMRDLHFSKKILYKALC